MRSERSTSYSSTPTSSFGVPISSSAACEMRALRSPTAVSMDDSSAALITRGTLPMPAYVANRDAPRVNRRASAPPPVEDGLARVEAAVDVQWPVEEYK